MAEAGVVGLGRLTLSRRERMVVVEPRGTGMALFTLRAAEEVRAAQFGMAEGELDAEMVANRAGQPRSIYRGFRAGAWPDPRSVPASCPDARRVWARAPHAPG